MSNDTYHKTYAPIPGGPEEMELEVYYSLGGPNWFTGGTTARGVWVSFWPVERGEGFTRRKIPDDRGRRILLEQLPRKNKKRGEFWANVIASSQRPIFDAAILQDWEGVKTLIAAASTADAA